MMERRSRSAVRSKVLHLHPAHASLHIHEPFVYAGLTPTEFLQDGLMIRRILILLVLSVALASFAENPSVSSQNTVNRLAAAASERHVEMRRSAEYRQRRRPSKGWKVEGRKDMRDAMQPISDPGLKDLSNSRVRRKNPHSPTLCWPRI